MSALLFALVACAVVAGLSVAKWDEIMRVARGETVMLDSGAWVVPARLPKFLQAERGQLGFRTILAGITVVIAGMLAVIVVDRFDSSLGTPADDNLSAAQNSTISGFSDMASLIGPLLLVGVAVLIINLLRSTR